MRHALTFRGTAYAIPAGSGLCTRCGALLEIEAWLAEACPGATDRLETEEMLEEFEGTLLVVSHDRYFLDRLVHRVVEVEDRRLVSHRKTFAEWWRAKQEAREGRRKGALERREEAAPDADPEAARRLHEERKAKSRDEQRLRSRLGTLERKIARLEEEHKALTVRLEAACSDGTPREVVQALSGEFATLKGEIERLYGEWEGLASSA